MTTLAIFKGGSFVPDEAVPLAEGAKVRLVYEVERTEVEQKVALDRLVETLHKARKEANPNFVWDRSLAYDD